MRQLVWASFFCFVGCGVDSSRSNSVAVGTARQALSVAPMPPLNSVDASVQDFAPSKFFAGSDRVYFVAKALGAGAELWSTDGTTQGTRLVRDIQPGLATSYVKAFANLGPKTVFVASENSIATEVWATDGTPAGTGPIVDLAPGPVSGFSDSYRGGGRGIGAAITVFNGAAYYPGPNASLVRTDGTAAGTSVVSTAFWASDYNESPVTVFKGELYGCARTNAPNLGYELYAYSPADGGTRLVADLTSGSNSTYPYTFVASGDVLYFACRAYSSSDTYLCSTDGVTARFVGRMQKVSVSEPGPEMIAIDGGVLLRGVGPSPTYLPPTQLFRADNDGGFGLVATINPSGDSWPGSFTPLNGLVSFSRTTAWARRSGRPTARRRVPSA